MTLVGLLTIAEKDSLVGQLYDEDSYFFPIQDDFNQWVISTEEIDQCVNSEFIWVKDLPLIEFIPKPEPPLHP
jgi:hypothetical protein